MGPRGRHNIHISKRRFPPVQGLRITVGLEVPRSTASPARPRPRRRVPHKLDLHFSDRHCPRPAAAAVPPARRSGAAKHPLPPDCANSPTPPPLVASGGLPSLPPHTCQTTTHPGTSGPWRGDRQQGDNVHSPPMGSSPHRRSSLCTSCLPCRFHISQTLAPSRADA